MRCPTPEEPPNENPCDPGRSRARSRRRFVARRARRNLAAPFYRKGAEYGSRCSSRTDRGRRTFHRACRLRRRPHTSLRRRRHSSRRASRRVARRDEGRADGRDGAVGLRQVDADAHSRRARPADGRHGDAGRHRDHRAERQRPHEAPAPSHRVHLPVLQPPADAERGREHRPAADDRGGEAGQGLGRRADQEHRPRFTQEPPPIRALGRPATACGDRPRTRQPSDDHVRGRADRQPGFEDERRDPRAHAQLGGWLRADARDGHA